MLNTGAGEEKVCDNLAGKLHLRYKACEVAKVSASEWEIPMSATLRTTTEKSPADSALNGSEAENKFDEGD